jgi:hypothetical protein
MLFIEIQPFYCFRGKMCRKLEKWDPLMASHPMRETRLCIYRPCLLATLGRRPIGACRIFSHNFPQKNSGWGGVGACITLAPHYQYRLSINRRVWGFGIKSKKVGCHLSLSSFYCKCTMCGVGQEALPFTECGLKWGWQVGLPGTWQTFGLEHESKSRQPQ